MLAPVPCVSPCSKLWFGRGVSEELISQLLTDFGHQATLTSFDTLPAVHYRAAQNRVHVSGLKQSTGRVHCIEA